MLDDFGTAQHIRIRAPQLVGANAAGYVEPISKPRPFGYRTSKQIVDKILCLVALPLICVVGAVLLVLNRWYNPGPLMFCQKRMGQNGQVFTMWKFRTMVPSDIASRDPTAPLEVSRITPLGKFLRSTRIDELPNFVNVIRGEMSVVGPRPDSVQHAEHFLDVVPGYRERLSVQPGITGLAQIEMGYAVGAEETSRKVQWDRQYVDQLGLVQDIMIMVRTFYVIFAGLGR